MAEANDLAELALGDEQAGAGPALDLIAAAPALHIAQTVSTIGRADSITLVQHKVRRS
jgi:hypothetical protein